MTTLRNDERQTVIFLDVDGVLNRRQEWSHMYQLNDQCIKDFCVFAIKNHADVVLTSSWRKGYNRLSPSKSLPHIITLIDKLSAYGVNIIGKTNDLNHKRAAEIEDYLQRHPEIGKYIILDDDIGEYEREIKGLHIVNCETGFTKGTYKFVVI